MEILKNLRNTRHVSHMFPTDRYIVFFVENNSKLVLRGWQNAEKRPALTFLELCLTPPSPYLPNIVFFPHICF